MRSLHLPSPKGLHLGVAACALVVVAACSGSDNNISGLPTVDLNLSRIAGFEPLKAALVAARREANGGFNLDMWAAVVDRNGLVVAVVFTGATATDQWPGSRVIAAQKANTANAFSLPHLALSTANLYAATQPGGTLFGLQEANPTNDEVAYGGDAGDYGTPKDFMVGKRIGGTNVFGGGLALYDADGQLVGGLGVSGDASCADHNIAWKMRYNLRLDHVPAGVADKATSTDPGDDNIIYDFTNGVSASGFGHPECSAAATSIGKALPQTHPIGH
ncbi:MAG TPA: heme-binding protein [Gemmatimonadales bacterium]|nr:heme-binding protein [Gemmatimonadales bacterium]